MPPTPIVVLEIDDSTPADQAPFTQDVSMWSFANDQNLGTRTASETFRTIHEASDGSRSRGYPERVTRATFELLNGFVEAEEVTWRDGAELAACHSLLPTGETAVEKSLHMLFETVATAGRHFGPDRMRLVFAFS